MNLNFRSASLVFFSEQIGFLLCREKRSASTTCLHPIGGKIEHYDQNIIFTAIREFIEETPICLSQGYLNFLGKRESLESYLFYTLSDPDKTFSEDVCVSRESQLYHKFYIVNLSDLDLEFQEIILSLHEIPFQHESIERLEWVRITKIVPRQQFNQFSFLTKELKKIIDNL
jgi:hypothetical protein